MRIGRKLNLLIIWVIVAIFIGLGIFVINYIPAAKMKTEKDSLFALDSAVSELRADLNKMPISSFDSQLQEVVLKNEALKLKFEQIDTFIYLKKDPEIAESLSIIARLYTLFEVNYEAFIDTTSRMVPHLEAVFLSDKVKIDGTKDSRMMERYDRKDEILSLIDSFYSVISIIDSNLISTHLVVEEQFDLINSLIMEREKNSYIIGIAIVVILSLLAFLTAVRITRRITKNIQIAAEGIKRMGSGDLSSDFKIKSKDELGELGSDLNMLTDSLKTALRSMKNSSNRGVDLKQELIASANQTSAAAAQIAANSKAISNQFNMLSEKVEGAAGANQSMKKSLQLLDENVQEQTAMVEESTSSVTEMISSINNVAEITTRKKTATDSLVKTAESGGAKLGATIRVINEINESLDQIKGMAGIIQQIASQTNLLAMNAAIEAAHAGDAGRGFAVVADEIRKLAEASSMNSKQIGGVLKEVVVRIETASESGRETETAFSEIDREVKSVAQSLDEISASMDELNVGGKQILEAMTGLQDVSVNVAGGSGKMTDSSNSVTESIEIVSRITTEVAESANEISLGISEVSSAMMLVNELSNNLGEITDRLEEEAARFRTEEDEDAGRPEGSEVSSGAEEPASGEVLTENSPTMEISSGEVTTVTMARDSESSAEIENLDEAKDMN